MKRVVASAPLLCSLTGCFRMSVRSGATPSGPENEDTSASFVYGLTLGIVTPLKAEYVRAEDGSR